MEVPAQDMMRGSVMDGRIAKIAPSKKREETSSDRKPGSDQGNR